MLSLVVEFTLKIEMAIKKIERPISGDWHF
jgi:hypothetical protein